MYKQRKIMREMKTTKMEWVPVEDGLPPNFEKGKLKYYLVRLENYYPNFEQGILLGNVWCSSFNKTFTTKVTHWCDVP